MAQDPAQICAQIEAVRARLERELDELGPVVSRRLRRARRALQVGTVAGIILIARHFRSGRKSKHRRRGRARGGCCSKCHGKHRRR
jgi:hypothetical protein